MRQDNPRVSSKGTHSSRNGKKSMFPWLTDHSRGAPHSDHMWVSSVSVRGTWWRFYFRLYPGTIRSPQVVEFLDHLRRHLRGKLLIVWDGLRQHRSRMIRDYVDELNGQIHLEYLPAYAPELNPV
jgi:hypothetical protein